MTAAELIRTLASCAPDAEVLISVDGVAHDINSIQCGVEIEDGEIIEDEIGNCIVLSNDGLSNRTFTVQSRRAGCITEI